MIEVVTAGSMALSASVAAVGTWFGAAAMSKRKSRAVTSKEATVAGRARTAGGTPRQEGALIYWSEKYMLHIPPIDRQHKVLVDLINRVFTAMKRGAGLEELKATLDELIAYTRRHFADEERLLERYGFPALQYHRSMHRKLEDDISLMYGDLDARGKTLVALKLMRFLKQWLVEHILVEDMQYANHIHAVRAGRPARRR
ncbi:MAG: hemerythrin family protein [Nitrospinae bacterium]|nr:hemerythrin family protein [Nitrospinota bacterium]